jgi:hypothetical protein
MLDETGVFPAQSDSDSKEISYVKIDLIGQG